LCKKKKVHELCDDFCLRYIDRLKGKMPSELSLEDTKDSFSENLPSTSSALTAGGNGASSSYSTSGNNTNSSSSSNPINSSSSSSFTSTSSNEFHTGLPTANLSGGGGGLSSSSSSSSAHHHQPVLKIESDYSSNASAAAAAAAAQMAFNNSTNTNPSYASLVDCSTPIPSHYPAYHAAPPPSHLTSHMQHGSYHSLAGCGGLYPPHQSYMQPFFGAQSHLGHLGQPSLYGNSQYDFGNVENANLELAAAFHPNIKTEYGMSGSGGGGGGGGSNKRMLNDSELKEHHTLTLLGSNGSSQIIHGSASAGQLGNSGNNSFSNHNLDTNSETGKHFS
jgi:hypothetical protein